MSLLKKDNLFSFFVPLTFFVFVLITSHFREVFTYNADEAISLMTALLHSKGYILYQEILFDQPPLFVLVLSPILKLFGSSIYFFRVLLLFSSTLLIWALFKIIQKTLGNLPAICAVVLLSFSTYFMYLSIAVLRGLPAISLAVLATYSLFLYQETGKKKHLVLSGCLMALSLEMKFFTGIFIPVLLGQLIIFECGRNSSTQSLLRRVVFLVLLWGASLTLVFIYISYFVVFMDFSQIYQPYALIRDHSLFKLQQNLRGFFVLKEWLKEEFDVFFLALGGLIFIVRRLITGGKKLKFVFVPFSLVLFSSLLIITHYPVWYTYRPLVLVPLSWLAAYGVKAAFSKKTFSLLFDKNIITKIQGIIVIGSIGAILILAILFIPLKYSIFQDAVAQAPKLSEYQKTINLIKQYDSQAKCGSPFVIADESTIPFYAGLLTHPYLAGASYKRFFTRMISVDVIAQIIRKEKPRFIILNRFLMFSKIVYLLKDYKAIGNNCYVLKTLLIDSTHFLGVGVGKNQS